MNEDIKVKYQIAINLFIHEGQVHWSRYNAMLVVNTALFALLTFNKDSFDLKVLSFFAPIFGLILCGLWRTMTNRGFIWMKHWMVEANKLEKQLKGPLTPIQNGDELRLKMGEGFTKNASIFIIKIFIVIYIILMVNNIILFSPFLHMLLKLKF